MQQKLYFILKPSKIKNQYYVDNPFDKQPYKLENMLKNNDTNQFPTQISNPDLNDIFVEQKYKMMQQNNQNQHTYGNNPYKPKMDAPNQFTSAYSRKPQINDVLDKELLEQHNKQLNDNYERMADEFIEEARVYNQKVKKELQQLQYQLQVDQKYMQLANSNTGLAEQCEVGLTDKYLNDQMPILPTETIADQPRLFRDQYINKINNDYVINYKPVDVDAILNAAKQQHQDILQSAEQSLDNISPVHPKSPSPPRTTINMTNPKLAPIRQKIPQTQGNIAQTNEYWQLTKSDYEFLHTGRHLLSSDGAQQEVTEMQKFIQDVTKPKEQKAYIQEMYDAFSTNLLNLQHNSGQSELLSQKAHFATILQSEREKQVGTDIEQQHAIQALLYRIKELEDQQTTTALSKQPQVSQGQSLQSMQTVIQNSNSVTQNQQAQMQHQNDILAQQLHQSQQMMAQQEAQFRQMLQQQQIQYETNQQSLMKKLTDLQMQQQQMQTQQNINYGVLTGSVVKAEKASKRPSSEHGGESSSSNVQSVQYNRQMDESPGRPHRNPRHATISGHEMTEQPRPPISNGSNTSAFSSTPGSVPGKPDQKQIDLLRVGDMSLSRISVNNSKATAITTQRDASLEPQDADPLLKQFVKAKSERPEPVMNPQEKQKLENELKAAFQKKQQAMQQQQLGGISATCHVPIAEPPAPPIGAEASLDVSLLPPKRPGSNSQMSLNASLQGKKEGMSSLFIDLDEPEKLCALKEIHEGGLRSEQLETQMFNKYVKSAKKDSLDIQKKNDDKPADIKDEHKKKRKKKAKGISPLDAAKIKAEDSINIPL